MTGDGQLNLLAALGPQPLPGTWACDGVDCAVQWGPFEVPVPVFICPPPPPECCPSCGSQATSSMAMGTVLPPTAQARLAAAHTRQPGAGQQVPDRPLLRLVAFRCPDCWHTRIHDRNDWR